MKIFPGGLGRLESIDQGLSICFDERELQTQANTLKGWKTTDSLSERS
jgi:hypothetical protein